MKTYPDDVSIENMTKVYVRDSPALFDPRNDIAKVNHILGDIPAIWFNSNRGYSHR